MSKVDMERKKSEKSAASGVIALIFLIIGFQGSNFFEKSSTDRHRKWHRKRLQMW